MKRFEKFLKNNIKDEKEADEAYTREAKAARKLGNISTSKTLLRIRDQERHHKVILNDMLKKAQKAGK